MKTTYVDYEYVTKTKYITSNDTCSSGAALGADSLALWL